MSTRRRDPVKEHFWRDVVTRWRRGGLSVRAFCARESLSEPSFYVWRRELARRGGGDGTAPPFVPVKVVEPQAAGVTANPGAIELVLRDCLVVRVRAGFDADTLRAVVAVLAGEPPGEPSC
jgi:transposase